MKRKKSFLKKITLLFVLFFLIHVGHTFVTNDAVGLPEKLQGFGTIKQEEHPIASDKYGWELVLVNRDNYIPDDYEMDLMELSNGQKIDSRIYPYLQEMFDDARNAGVYPFVRDGYRTAEEQQQILDDKIAAYRSEGYTKHMAEETAMEWGALPGTSEHQLGLAVDINADSVLEDDEGEQWNEIHIDEMGNIKLPYFSYYSDRVEERIINLSHTEVDRDFSKYNTVENIQWCIQNLNMKGIEDYEFDVLGYHSDAIDLRIHTDLLVKMIVPDAIDTIFTDQIIDLEKLVWITDVSDMRVFAQDI